MKKEIVLSCILCMLLIFPSMALADWDPGDGHKMHFPQLPDPLGWGDVQKLDRLRISISGYHGEWMCWLNLFRG